MGRAHQDVVGDFPERYSQVDDVILRTAALREVADVNNASYGRLPGWKWLKI